MNDKHYSEDKNDTSQKRKRGRPRKNQVVDSSDKKKKGRKPKDTNNLIKQLSEKEDDDIILHLPINLLDIKKFKKEENDDDNNESVEL